MSHHEPEPRTEAADPAASAHRRTRRDHATETAEDYVEAIAEIIEARETCRVRDLAERFGVSHVTVVRIVARLEQADLVRTAPYQPIELMPGGRNLARACRDRHDTVVRFLIALGVRPSVAAIDAEGIEHHVSDETLELFRAFADAAADDPSEESPAP